MVHAATKPGQRTGRRFYIGIGIFLIVMSIAGFGPSLLDPSKRNGPPNPLVMIHGLVTLLFLLLFLTQATLISKGRKDVHRRLGVIGAFLAVAVVVIGLIASIEAQRRGHDLSGDLSRGGEFTPDGIIGPLVLFFIFTVLVTAAICYRHRPEIHKRLMLFAVLVPLGVEPVNHLLGYLVGHWPGFEGARTPISIAVLLIFYALSAIHDRQREGRIHPLSLWIPVGLFVTFTLLFGVVGTSSAFIRFSEWLILGK